MEFMDPAKNPSAFSLLPWLRRAHMYTLSLTSVWSQLMKIDFKKNSKLNRSFHIEGTEALL
jgi:hypothetical protein